MTQTEILGLNCWTEEDPVQVSQLSENFERLDRAQNIVKLLEVEDTEGGHANRRGFERNEFTGLPVSGF